MPTAPTYCAAKTGLVALAASLRQPLFMRHNVRMNVICPGFVDTPMVDGAALETGMRRLLSFAAPRLSADEAAGCIQLGLERDVPLIAFPFVTYATLSLLTALPYGVQQTLSGVLWRWGCLPSDEI